MALFRFLPHSEGPSSDSRNWVQGKKTCGAFESSATLSIFNVVACESDTLEANNFSMSCVYHSSFLSIISILHSSLSSPFLALSFFRNFMLQTGSLEFWVAERKKRPWDCRRATFTVRFHSRKRRKWGLAATNQSAGGCNMEEDGGGVKKNGAF